MSDIIETEEIDTRFDKLEKKVNENRDLIVNLAVSMNKRFDEIDKRFDELRDLIIERT